ncbi:hypothetical protein ALC60_09186 [Trachymyrmex zeteki]|uniref:Uncharacterized protein n=1 Tax=Mycetomoellerius zeteki TaxID=64791 RepID=A0A151WV44_9HYME|nr:hypothetical protein ALC60_09186 [Trachymyrmex zeteki]
MRGPSLPREEHKSGINSVRRKSGDFKKSLYTPVGPSAKKYREGGGTKGPPGKKERKKKDEADRKSSGNEALSFSSGASPISLTSANLPAYQPACVHVSNNARVYAKGPPLCFLPRGDSGPRYAPQSGIAANDFSR